MPAPSSLIIACELPCGGCNYDIRGQPLSGVCPECGRPIEQSLTSIAAAPKAYLLHLRRGLSLALAAFALGPALYVSLFVAALFVVPDDGLFSVVVAGLFLLGPIGSAIGWLRITTPQPDLPLPGGRFVAMISPPRIKVVRTLAVAFASFHVLLFVSMLDAMCGIGLIGESVAYVLMFCALVSWSARNFFGLGVLGQLAEHSAIRSAATNCRIGRWLSIAALFAQGLVVAGAMLAAMEISETPVAIAYGAAFLAAIVTAVSYAFVLVVMLRAVTRHLKLAQSRAGEIVVLAPPTVSRGA